MADWDMARNYMKHVRTGEHYGVTSKIYKLTEEKWADVDMQWKKNSELLIAKAGKATSWPWQSVKAPLSPPHC
jgi:hypothetical protein